MARHEVVNVDEMTLRPYRAALVIGAHGNIADSGASAYDATDWLETNLRLGPLQSDKTFFDGSTPLPSSWSSPANNCYEIEQSLPSSSWPECVIAYKVQESEAQLTGIPCRIAPRSTDHHGVVAGARERRRSRVVPGPVATARTSSATSSSSRSNIRQAAAADGVTPEVLVGMDANTYAYEPMSDSEANESLEGDCSFIAQAGTSCSFIPPGAYVDVYLADHYALQCDQQPRSWAPASGPTNWQDWLACVLPQNKPIGLAEYGLNPNGSDPVRHRVRHRRGLGRIWRPCPKTTHEETALWELWDSGAGHARELEPSTTSRPRSARGRQPRRKTAAANALSWRRFVICLRKRQASSLRRWVPLAAEIEKGGER